MKHFISFCTIATTLLSCSSTSSTSPISIIPQPQSIERLTSEGIAAKDTVGAITFSVDSTINNAEGYTLTVKDGTVAIAAGSTRGYTLALATLEQLVDNNGNIPAVKITDAPRFEWRGFMLDVSRHFQSKEYLMQVVDMLAYHKLNKLHLHLTDDIGWRMEIEAYPELAQKGAWRIIKDESVPFINYEMSQKGAENTYGGYYTKEDMREVIAYAATKNIEIIPEIEMPGHSQAAIECYPELSCNPEQMSQVFCAGNPKTFEFLEGVIDEIVELFPSEYIHVGGDEVGVGNWENCPKCKKINPKGSQVQKYFVSRMEQYIASKGKRMIGWDEVVKDELGPTAVIMSWTGWEGGITAAKANYDVVMCPLHYVYFDHYQAQSDLEPQAWGGDNSLHRVWEFPVVPEDMPAELASKIKGGQANLWTENIETTRHIEYMMLPRLSALSEALWCENRTLDSTNWAEFTSRVIPQLDRYKAKGWNYATSAFTPQWKLSDGEISLKTEIELFPIYYTLDGTKPTVNSTKYTAPFTPTPNSTLRAATFNTEGEMAGNDLIVNNLAHLATGAKVHYTSVPNPQYDGEGENPLTDNNYAWKRGDDKHWVGFEKEDMNVTVELARAEKIEEVVVRFMQCKSGSSVVLPSSMTIAVSTDGENFSEVSTQTIAPDSELNSIIVPITAKFSAIDAKFVRVQAKNIEILPAGIPRAGGNAWIFTDEIAVK